MPILTPEQAPAEMLQAALDELRKGAVQKKHPFHTVVLSTVKGDRPESRWVVFRKLTPENKMLIFTDARSEKVDELRAKPLASLLFYHPRQGLQVRVNGTVTLHQNDELSATYWPGVKGSPGASSYQTVQAPGTPTESIADGNTTDATVDDAYFMILAFEPDRLEVLQLGREGHIRAAFEKDGEEWKGALLVP